jgi:hypothetical protein
MARRRRQPDESDYDAVWRIMADTMQRFVTEGVGRPAIIPALNDLVVSLVLHEAGEEGAWHIILRIQERVLQWKEGRFPTDDHDTNERWTPQPRRPNAGE